MLVTKHASIARKEDAKENEVNSYLQEIDSNKPVGKFQSLGHFTVIILIMVRHDLEKLCCNRFSLPYKRLEPKERRLKYGI